MEIRLEEIRTKLGLKTPDRFYEEDVVPRLKCTNLSAREALSIGTGKTTEMLLLAAHYLTSPNPEPILLLSSSSNHARHMKYRLETMLRALGHEDRIGLIDYGTVLVPQLQHFFDHSWVEAQNDLRFHL